ncbi:MAG: L,D-transpeptidase family protein [Planctomycetota bacterium]
MRSIVVLVLAAALVWAGFQLFGTKSPGDVHGSEGGGGATLVEPPAGDGPGTGATGPAATAPEVASPEDANPFAEVPEVPDFGDPEAWVALGGDLAHGRLDAVENALGRIEPPLPASRAQFLRCLVGALAGKEDARTQASALFERDALDDREVALLTCAFGSGEPPAPGGHVDALDLGAELAVLAAAANRSAALGELQVAARRFTRLFDSELASPWETRPHDLDAWVASLRELQRRYRWDPRSEWPHLELTVQNGEGLTSIRQRALEQVPTLHISTGLVARANRLTGEVIHPGQTLRVPTDPVTVLVDVSKHWLLYRIGPDVVDAYPVGTGARGKETLLGSFVVGNKQKNPTWFPQGRAPVPFGHPENPLGTRWLGWRLPESDSDTSFGFHGTWQPDTIGTDASEGCVRLENANVEQLFDILPQGASFVVRP